ncbi:hypothetical protein BS297_17900 [Rhodococcus erythropolis]|uniref:Uncharacterized protein n=1 Tax=Rhodococcus erythropolis TaxID=1833 RepID=A0A0C2ZNF5_RHOER|nr:hypothetical protein BS297_17900 [Rhodococcus erythropolis]KIM14400.1 hypothetical protein QV65_32495 [Rhodococcus erythropolis]
MAVSGEFTYPPIDYFAGQPPIEIRTDTEWEDLARFVIAESGVPDGDVAALASALRASTTREQQLRSEVVAGWAAIEEEAYEMDERLRQGAS